MSTTKRIIVVSHTHWDREWHRTFQQFRLRLAAVLDALLDAMSGHDPFPRFTLDGQTILLHDYVEIRPARADDLRRYLRAGQLLTGPWYVQPDEFLVSGESLARNLMLGLRDSAEWAGEAGTMRVGYLLDQFGHIGQMPQILRGCGINNAVFWRGRARSWPDGQPNPADFWWVAPDGSRVQAVHLVDSYSNAGQLPTQPAALAGRLRTLYEGLRGFSHSGVVLLMNGADHVFAQAGLPSALREAAKLLEPEIEVIHADLPTYLAAVRGSLADNAMEVGELRSSQGAPLLPAVLSTRMYLKQRNSATQTLLEVMTEPWVAWASLLTAGPYPLNELELAWRYLLQNHPHDSICGCGIDQIHREMITRFDWANQIASDMARRSIAQIAGKINTAGLCANSDGAQTFVVFNPADSTRTSVADLELTLDDASADYVLLDDTGKPVAEWRWIDDGSTASPAEATVMDAPITQLPDRETLLAQVVDDRVLGQGVRTLDVGLEDDILVANVVLGDPGRLRHSELADAIDHALALIAEHRPSSARIRISQSARRRLEVLARDVPPFGYRTYLLQQAETSGAPAGSSDGQGRTADAMDAGPTIVNEYIRVVADPTTGALTITDLRTGLLYPQCNVFVDGGDCGDTYTYCSPARDTLVSQPLEPPVIISEHTAVGQTLTIAQTLRVPDGLTQARTARSRQRAELRISSKIHLLAGVPRVDCETTVLNTAHDHRLRVHFGTPFTVDHADAAGAFEIVHRQLTPIQPPEAETWKNWAEQPAPTAPHQGFVIVHDSALDGSHDNDNMSTNSSEEAERAIPALAICSRGLPEYEVIQQSADGDAGATIGVTLLRCVGWLSRGDLPNRPQQAGPQLETPEAQCLGSHTFIYSLLPHDGSTSLATLWQTARHTPVEMQPVAISLHEGTLPPAGSFCSVDDPRVAISAIKGAEDGHGLIIRLVNLAHAPVTTTLRIAGSFQHAWITNLCEIDQSELSHSIERDDQESRLSVTLSGAQIMTLRLQ